MKKNFSTGMVLVMALSSVQVSVFDEAVQAAGNSDKIEKKTGESKTFKNGENIKNDKIDSDDKSSLNVRTSVSIKQNNTSNKLELEDKPVTEKIYKLDDKAQTKGEEDSSESFDLTGSINFELEPKKDADKFNFDEADLTSGSAVGVSKNVFAVFDIGDGDINVRKSVGSESSVVVEQNGMLTVCAENKKILFKGTSENKKIIVEDGVKSEFFISGLSISLYEDSFVIGNGSDITLKLVNDSENTICDFKNNGKLTIQGETGSLTIREAGGILNIEGGVVKATENCGNIDKLYISGGSVDLRSDVEVFCSADDNLFLKPYIIKLDGVGGAVDVEADILGKAFNTKTDINGNLFLFLPDEDVKAVFKTDSAAYVAYIEKNGKEKYVAEKIPEINRVDVDVNQKIDSVSGDVCAEFKIKIPESLKLKKDFKIGIQCFEKGWLVDDSISEKNIAKAVSDENGEYYTISIFGLDSGKDYNCRVFAMYGDDLNFSDLMSFKTSTAEAEDKNKDDNKKYEVVSISGLKTVYNQKEQEISVICNADFYVEYFKNGKKLDGKPKEAGVYTARIIVDDKRYEYFEKDVEFIIEKADPIVVETPSVTPVLTGKAVSASKFKGGVVSGLDGEISGSFKWKDAEEAVLLSEEHIAEFIPDDKNYNSVSLAVATDVMDKTEVVFLDNLKPKEHIEKGGILILKVDAASNDNGAVLYQWYKDGMILEDCVASILVIDNFKESDSGRYYVTATNLKGDYAGSNLCEVTAGEGYLDEVEEVSEVYTREITEDVTEETTEDLSLFNYEEETVEDLDKTDYDEEYAGGFSRITDSMLIDVYGKAVFSDDGTAVINVDYNSGGKTNMAVYQLNESGCFIKVKNFDYSGGKIKIITDRDFPVIIGYEDNSFFDIKYHWDEDDINFVSAMGIMQGTTSGSFSPDSNITRGDFIEALYNLSGRPYAENRQAADKFFDIGGDSAYTDSVCWAYENGFVNGLNDTEFGIGLSVTREQAAVIISKYITGLGYSVPDKSVPYYSDSVKMSDWAEKSIYDVSRCGIMRDLGFGRFQPKVLCTRAEVATILKKIIQFNIEM